MNLLAHVTTWMNVCANAAGRILLFPIALLPGWLSNTIIAAVTGVLLLIIFKRTSNQQAIGRVRDDIRANILAQRLFTDSISVTLQVQARLFRNSLQLLTYSIVPLLVMILPVSLLLGQLTLWYQSRPLMPGEETIITMKLDSKSNSSWPNVSIEPIPTAEVIIGPVKVLSKREIHWKIRACKNGYDRIVFNVNKQRIEKELAIGDGFMRISNERPGWYWSDILLHPWEKPFGPDSPVWSIRIDYPDRLSRTSGTDWWLIYFFIASLVFALAFKPLLKVRI